MASQSNYPSSNWYDYPGPRRQEFYPTQPTRATQPTIHDCRTMHADDHHISSDICQAILSKSSKEAVRHLCFGFVEDEIRPLFIAVDHSRTDLLEMMVNEFGFFIESELNETGFVATPFVHAARNGKLDVARFLVQNLKSDVNRTWKEAPTSADTSVLDFSIQSGRLDDAKLYIEELKADVNLVLYHDDGTTIYANHDTYYPTNYIRIQPILETKQFTAIFSAIKQDFEQ